MKKDIYQINGMGCQKCVVKIETKVSQIDGVSKAKVDLNKKQLEVEYSEGVVSKENFKEAIEDLGYELV